MLEETLDFMPYPSRLDTPLLDPVLSVFLLSQMHINDDLPTPTTTIIRKEKQK